MNANRIRSPYQDNADMHAYAQAQQGTQKTRQGAKWTDPVPTPRVRKPRGFFAKAYALLGLTF